MKITLQEVDMLLDEAKKALQEGNKYIYLYIHMSLFYLTTDELLIDTYKRLKPIYPDLKLALYRKMIDDVDSIYLSKTEITDIDDDL